MSRPHWTRKTHLFASDEYICSECRCSTDKPYSRCPNCGADMNGKSKYDANWVDEAEIMDILFGD